MRAKRSCASAEGAFDQLSTAAPRVTPPWQFSSDQELPHNQLPSLSPRVKLHGVKVPHRTAESNEGFGVLLGLCVAEQGSGLRGNLQDAMRLASIESSSRWGRAGVAANAACAAHPKQHAAPRRDAPRISLMAEDLSGVCAATRRMRCKASPTAAAHRIAQLAAPLAVRAAAAAAAAR